MGIPLESLAVIQESFHQLIRKRAEEFRSLANLRDLELPQLSLETLEDFVDEFGSIKQRRWFAVPGMYGGFAYKLEYQDGQFRLLCDSWCRVRGGSGQSHEITIAGTTLTAEGFA